MKGDEAFADRAFREAREPRAIRRNLTVETVAQEISRAQKISLAQMRSLGQGRVGSRARECMCVSGVNRVSVYYLR